jgi:hypothetical protein
MLWIEDWGVTAPLWRSFDSWDFVIVYNTERWKAFSRGDTTLVVYWGQYSSYLRKLSPSRRRLCECLNVGRIMYRGDICGRKAKKKWSEDLSERSHLRNFYSVVLGSNPAMLTEMFRSIFQPLQANARILSNRPRLLPTEFLASHDSWFSTQLIRWYMILSNWNSVDRQPKNQSLNATCPAHLIFLQSLF